MEEEEHTALKAANIVMLREKETEAWERAQRALQAFSTKAALPTLIDTFLREHWVGVLQAVAAKDNDNGKRVERRQADDGGSGLEHRAQKVAG